jgi:uncharacterized protein (PEP-CTERM system associated)
LTDFRTLFLEEQLFTLVDPITGDPILDPVTGQPTQVALDMAVVGDSTLVNERLDASYYLQGKRSTLKVSVDHSKQIYQDIPNGDQTLMGLKVAFDRTLDGKTSANAEVGWRRSETSTDLESDTTYVQVGMKRELGPKTDLRLNYRHSDRDSDATGDSYDENRVTVALDIDL